MTLAEERAVHHEAAMLLSGDWYGPAYHVFQGALTAMREGIHPGTDVPVKQRVRSLKTWIGLLRMFARACENIARHYEDVVLPAQEALL